MRFTLAPPAQSRIAHLCLAVFAPEMNEPSFKDEHEDTFDFLAQYLSPKHSTSQGTTFPSTSNHQQSTTNNNNNQESINPITNISNAPLNNNTTINPPNNTKANADNPNHSINNDANNDSKSPIGANPNGKETQNSPIHVYPSSVAPSGTIVQLPISLPVPGNSPPFMHTLATQPHQYGIPVHSQNQSQNLHQRQPSQSQAQQVHPIQSTSQSQSLAQNQVPQISTHISTPASPQAPSVPAHQHQHPHHPPQLHTYPAHQHQPQPVHQHLLQHQLQQQHQHQHLHLQPQVQHPYQPQPQQQHQHQHQHQQHLHPHPHPHQLQQHNQHVSQAQLQPQVQSAYSYQNVNPPGGLFSATGLAKRNLNEIQDGRMEIAKRSKTEITERTMAFHPDYRSPFVDIQDVHFRLACYHIFNSKVEPEEAEADQLLKQAQSLMAQLDMLHQQIQTAAVAWSDGGLYREDLAVLERLAFYDEKTETDALKLQYNTAQAALQARQRPTVPVMAGFPPSSYPSPYPPFSNPPSSAGTQHSPLLASGIGTTSSTGTDRVLTEVGAKVTSELGIHSEGEHVGNVEPSSLEGDLETDLGADLEADLDAAVRSSGNPSSSFGSQTEASARTNGGGLNGFGVRGDGDIKNIEEGDTEDDTRVQVPSPTELPEQSLPEQDQEHLLPEQSLSEDSLPEQSLPEHLIEGQFQSLHDQPLPEQYSPPTHALSPEQPPEQLPDHPTATPLTEQSLSEQEPEQSSQHTPKLSALTLPYDTNTDAPPPFSPHSDSESPQPTKPQPTFTPAFSNSFYSDDSETNR